MNTIEPSPSLSRIWIVAARPWALPASVMPVLLGTALAVTMGGATGSAIRFFVALLSMSILHTAANMRSDVSDFQRGLDTDITPVSGALVRGWLRPETVHRVSLVLFVIGSASGAGLALVTGPALWWIGLAGVAIGAAYSTLKYRALGDLAVGLNFGLLGAAGAWVVQTRSFSVYPMIAAVPIALLVVAILHANNWRDRETDPRCGVRTLATLLGDRGSEIYFGALLLVPFLWIAALILLPRGFDLGIPPLPASFLLVACAGPKALKLWRKARHRHTPASPLDFRILDGATAQFNLLFGLLCVAALILHALGAHKG